MARVHIGYFLEDIAQERFILAFVERVALELANATLDMTHDVRNAAGGSSRVLTEFESFLVRSSRQGEWVFDLLIVAIDGNREGPTKRTRLIRELVNKHTYPGHLICAVPDPHIEKWYLADPHGFQTEFGSSRLPTVPRLKAERDRYKQALVQAFSDAGYEAPLGGAEYGQEVVKSMDLYRAAKNDATLNRFISDLRSALIMLASLD